MQTVRYSFADRNASLPLTKAALYPFAQLEVSVRSGRVEQTRWASGCILTSRTRGSRGVLVTAAHTFADQGVQAKRVSVLLRDANNAVHRIPGACAVWPKQWNQRDIALVGLDPLPPMLEHSSPRIILDGDDFLGELYGFDPGASSAMEYVKVPLDRSGPWLAYAGDRDLPGFSGGPIVKPIRGRATKQLVEVMGVHSGFNARRGSWGGCAMSEQLFTTLESKLWS